MDCEPVTNDDQDADRSAAGLHGDYRRLLVQSRRAFRHARAPLGDPSRSPGCGHDHRGCGDANPSPGAPGQAPAVLHREPRPGRSPRGLLPPGPRHRRLLHRHRRHVRPHRAEGRWRDGRFNRPRTPSATRPTTVAYPCAALHSPRSTSRASAGPCSSISWAPTPSPRAVKIPRRRWSATSRAPTAGRRPASRPTAASSIPTSGPASISSTPAPPGTSSTPSSSSPAPTPIRSSSPTGARRRSR